MSSARITAFEELPDATALRVVPAEPALSAAQAVDLLQAIDKLFAQFQREGRVDTYGRAVAAEGHFVLIAWQDCGEGLSGCRKDMLSKLLLAQEDKHGVGLLAAPPVWLQPAGAELDGLRPAELKELVAAGRVDAQTPAWNTVAESVGAWRRGAGVPLRDIAWLATKVRRLQARAAS